MADSAVFHLLKRWGSLGLTLTPQQVSEATVRATIEGTNRELFVGWIYVLKGMLFSKMLPDRVTMLLAGLAAQHKNAFEFQSTVGKRLSKILLSNDSNINSSSSNSNSNISDNTMLAERKHKDD